MSLIITALPISKCTPGLCGLACYQTWDFDD